MRGVLFAIGIIAIFGIGFIPGEANTIGALQNILNTPAAATVLIAAVLALIAGIGGRWSLI
jgi:Na+/alanine symporter